MAKAFKRWAAATLLLMAAGLLPGSVALARKRRSRKVYLPKLVPIESAISVQDGKTVIIMSPPVQAAAGIAVEPLHGASAHRQMRTPARVLPVDGLAKLRKTYLATQAQLAKVRAKLQKSRKQLARLKSRQKTSAQTLQAAQAALQSDEADLRTSRQELGLVAAMARQNWGSVVAQWLEKGTPLLERVLNHQVLLVEVRVPARKGLGNPSHLQIELPGGRFAEGTFVSVSSKVERRGAALLYRLAAAGGLHSGTILEAHLKLGGMASGTVVPGSAVVWERGKPWVYQRTAPDRFLRRPVKLSHPKGKGFFVRDGFSPGDEIVVQGAQILLATETNSEIKPVD